MALTVNNTEISDVICNGVEVDIVNVNGVEVWRRGPNFTITYTSSEQISETTIEYATEAEFKAGINTINSNNTNIHMKVFSTNKLSSGNALFFGYGNIVTLDCSELDTSNVTDMTHMFAQMQGATSIILTGMDTSKVTLMTNMFHSCVKLNNLDFSTFNTSKVTNMSGMFQENWAQTSLDFSSFSFSSVTTMASMFYNCTGLTSIIWPSDSSSPKLTSIASLFSGCSSFTSITLPSLTYTNVTNLGELFYNCSKVTTITNINVLSTATKATALNHMFRSMTSLVSLDLSELNFPKATGIHAMFMGNTKMTTLKLPSMLGGTLTDGQYFLANCSSLVSVDCCEKIDTSNMTAVGHMFYGATKLKTSIKMNTSSASYSNMFVNAATATDSEITVFYVESNEDLVDNMIATKSSGSNVVKAKICVEWIHGVDTIESDGTFGVNDITISEDFAQSNWVVYRNGITDSEPSDWTSYSFASLLNVNTQTENLTIGYYPNEKQVAYYSETHTLTNGTFFKLCLVG